ncbi:conserved hypothetical protein [Ricinus communis]|uniref:Uncharacterized protein n=1 Tax=Ricinus communis TaxID=3988 RepID=B9T4L6_RICCO|nr:conserved hypothetical protein [Ricinus communis]
MPENGAHKTVCLMGRVVLHHQFDGMPNLLKSGSGLANNCIQSFRLGLSFSTKNIHTKVSMDSGNALAICTRPPRLVNPKAIPTLAVLEKHSQIWFGLRGKDRLSMAAHAAGEVAKTPGL